MQLSRVSVRGPVATSPCCPHSLPAAPRRASCRVRARHDAKAPAAREDEASSSNRLVDVLLGNAASRVKRGTCTCLQCKGKGAMSCPGCHGEGIVEAGHGTARMNMVRHVVAKVSSMVGDNTKATGQDWLQTNRCRRCHGVGQLVCVNCKGSGLRFKAGPDDVCELPERS